MLLLLLIILPIVVSLSIFAAGRYAPQKKTIEVLAFCGVLAELVVGLFVVFSAGAATGTNVTPYLSLDPLGALFLFIVLLLGAFATIYSIFYLQKESEEHEITSRKLSNYFSLLQLFLLSMFIAVTSNNVLLLWIAVEATTLSSAFLINFFDRPASIEAAWKYVIINSVALLLCLFGVFLFLAGLAHAAPMLTDFNWMNISSVAKLIDPNVLKLSFIFILIGYGTKMGLAPMHNWLPDAHSQAPVPVSALLSGALLNIALLALLRFKSVVDLALGGDFTQTIFIFFGVCSMVVAAVLILVQKEYKRMLAYSSIENMGIIVLGLALGGVAAVAALMHALYHSLAKSVLFLSTGNIAIRFRSYEIKNVRGLLRTLPVTGVLFFGGILAVAGVPPFGTFLTKFTILATGFATHPVLAVIASIALAIAFVGLMRHASSMLFGESTEAKVGEYGSQSYVPIAALFALLALLSIYIPTPLMLLINNAALQI